MKELVKIRRSLGLTQREFANLMYKDQRTISGYETGKIQPPLDFLKQLCEKFDFKITIGKDINLEKDCTKMDEMKNKIYEFIINNLSNEDYLQEELISYEDLIENYKDDIPNGFEDMIRDKEIPTDKIVGIVTKDEYKQLILFFLRDRNALQLYISDETNELDDNIDLYACEPGPGENPYLYCHNELWSVYLQRDKDKITKEEIIEVLFDRLTTMFSPAEYNEVVSNLIKDIDIRDLKIYVQDLTLWIDTVTVVREIYTDYNNDLRMNLYPKNPTTVLRDIHSRKKDLIEVPSSEVVVCSIDPLAGEMEIIVKPEYYNYLLTGKQ